ncbi:MAG: glycosyltransferase family 2 protein [Candidatus Omnitrophica bacterium]|nr:glycosyltransferase family 2 protein [Candidatus Omnitrophota bacterium]
MRNKNTISIILPVYNEEGNIKKTVQDSVDFLRLQEVFKEYEVIVVDDGSTDQTSYILEELAKSFECLKIITHPKNLGYGRAMVAAAKEARFSWVFMMDADGQFKINSLNDVVNNISDYDIITGYRYKRADPFYRIFIGKMYTFFVCLLFGLRLKDVNCGFKLFRREILDFDDTICHAGAFYTSVFIKAKTKGYKTIEIPIEHFPRLKGKQKGVGLKVIIEAVLDLARLIFSKRKRGKE